MTTDASIGLDALRSMRTDRRKRRVQDMEWFETLYRVYLAALIGGSGIVFLSSLVKDQPFTTSQFDTLRLDGPRYVGLVMAVVWFLGMRSGANGGPVNVEEAEVRHVLLAPVDRAKVLRHPAVQRMRTLAYTGLLAGAAAGLMIGKRAPKDWGWGRQEWVILGAAGGAMIGASFIIAALLVHSSRVNRSLVTFVATALVAWQGAAAFHHSHPWAPFTAFGRLALSSVNGVDFVSYAVLAVLAVIAVHQAGQLRVEALARRSALVSQLKFAVTLQDIRTVVLLRRQLSQEHMREKPWFKIPALLRKDPVISRCLHSLAHFPLRRIARMALLAATAAIAQVAVWRGTTPALVVSGLAMFMMGLDIVEPLSQEVDRPDRTDSLPVERGLLHAKHLVVPAIATIPFVVIGGVVAYLAEPHPMTIVAGALVGLPAALGGLCGAVINTIKGAPDPLSEANAGLYMPPEVSGMTTVIRAVWPPIVSIFGSTSLAVLRSAVDRGESALGSMVRGALGVGMLCFLVAGWVRQRDAIRAWFRNATRPQNLDSNSTSPTGQKA